MAFQEIIVYYTLNNSGAHTVTYESGTTKITVSPKATPIIIPITMKDSFVFTITESNNSDKPLTITLTQTSDTSVAVTPTSNEWDISSDGNEWECEIVESGTAIPVDQFSIPVASQIIDENIVIVGTIEIFPSDTIVSYHALQN